MKWRLVLFLSLVGTAFKQPDGEHQAMQSTNNTIRYLALGDSYTIGEGVAAQDRFPHLTAEMLRQQNPNVAEPQYIATTGWTTQNLQDALAQTNLTPPYDVVSLLIGVNDQYQKLDADGYRTRFTQLLKEALALAGNLTDRVFVLSIPDYSATPFVLEKDKMRVREEIAALNRINKEITVEHHVAYIDITPLTQHAASDGSLLAPDGLHYSGKEHRLWAERLAAAIRKVLP